MVRRISNVIGIDDAPFRPEHRGNVKLIGAVFSGSRLEGVVSTRVRRDGANASDKIISMLRNSRFVEHLQAVFLQGIAVAGFNVVDIHKVSDSLGLPVLVVCRRLPNYRSIRDALLDNVAGGGRKWKLIEKAGPMIPLAGVYVQCAGISMDHAAGLVERFAVHGRIPEPLRTAHLIASGI